MDNIHEHDNIGLHILQPPMNDKNLLILLNQMVSLIGFETNWTFGLFLDFLEEGFLTTREVFHYLVGEEEFCFYFRFCVVELWGLLLDGVGDRGFLLQDLVDHSAGFRDVRVLPLDFGCAIRHFAYWLVYDDFCVGLSHYFVYLMAFCTDQEWNHTFWYKNYNGKDLFFNFFKDLINIMKKTFTTLILFIHFRIKNLNKQMLYLYVASIQIRDTQIGIELDGLNSMLIHKWNKPRFDGLKLF